MTTPREKFEALLDAHGDACYRHEHSASARAAVLQAYDEAAGREGEAPVAWLYEDTLPDEYPYDLMFPHSKVDGVRMFPVFGPPKADAAAPDGWVLVPREPTEEMIVAFLETWFKKKRPVDDPEMEDAYAAMLAAAPARGGEGEKDA